MRVSLIYPCAEKDCKIAIHGQRENPKASEGKADKWTLGFPGRDETGDSVWKLK